MEEINDTAFANQLGRTNVEGKRCECFDSIVLLFVVEV